jgi:hypothetical protein
MGTGAPTITTGTATVNIVAADGFDSPVALTAAPLYSWAAVSGSLSPSTITGAGSSTLTISVTGAAVLIASSYPLTITATSGGVTQSIQVIVDVTSIGVSAPTFSPPAGTYSTPQTVTISDPAVGNEFIYYTTDGSTPTASSPVYVNPITITSTTMLKAIALQFDEGQSEVTTVTYNINLPGEDFSVAASPSSASVTAGQSGTTTVTIAPLNGFDSAVSFSCSGLPSGASCSFSPQTVTPSGGVASTTLNVTTNVSMAVMRRSAGPLFPISALAALVCCVGWKRRRLFQVLPLIAVSAVGLSLLNGCGSGNSGGVSSAPQSATYTITVNATSGSLQHSTSFSLTVN